MIEVPAELAAYHLKYAHDSGPEWTADLPALVETFLDLWELRPDGGVMHGVVSLVLPVVRADGTRAALKLQPATEENIGEGAGLRAWAGDGIVHLLDEATLPAPTSPHLANALLLERLDGDRFLEEVPDTTKALEILTGLLARLVAHPGPEGVRTLADIAADMLEEVPEQFRKAHPDDLPWLERCAAAVRELVGEPGDRLLHWDLHLSNVLAAEREPWLAIDPKPLVGDPGFELLPALRDRFPSTDVRKTVLHRFDLMVDGLGLDRDRAVGWTLGRVLQDSLWDLEDGESRISPDEIAIAEALLSR
ncbi:aminoglycoside phosphotransferase family protein [Nonomuraea africana]|uniref:Streptomycin 6-kinase n=1 Tax=Nonomuraea africana TaxID=46171 RepID=A0ABR9KR68_9ACTN|nr:aminoglycoside phosphotransferase family protein [Nonomuraea africana]MBE1564251.1 streptomycin 6-kinase [Nonomuraea africana]